MTEGLLRDEMSHPVGLGDIRPVLVECRMSLGRVSAWIHVAGELDLVSSPSFEAVIEDAERNALLVALDLREVTFMDASGLAVIARTARRTSRAERQIVLIVTPESLVDRLLALTGLDQQVDVIDDAHTRRIGRRVAGVASRVQASR